MVNLNALTHLKPYFSIRTVTILLVALVFASCRQSENKTSIDEEIEVLELEQLPAVEYPIDNVSSSAKVALGRLLFWDPIVSGHKDVACATCHHPDFAYTDALDLPIGVNGTGLGPLRSENSSALQLDSLIKRVPRNSPTVLNVAYNGLTSTGDYAPQAAPMFWDSRMLGLEAQCQGPPNSRSEMRGDAYEEDLEMDSLVARLASIPEYVIMFNTAFSGGIASVTRENYAKAMASFERTIVAKNSRYDKYLGGEMSALSENEKKGLLLFFGKAACGNCHSGPMLSDYNFHTLGVQDNTAHPEGIDQGKDDMYRFRTPSLRNVALTAPYMHSGVLATLKDVVIFMNEGVSRNENVLSGMMDHKMKPLNLNSEEIDLIVDFLETLTDSNFDRTIPSQVPSGLPVGGNIQ